MSTGTVETTADVAAKQYDDPKAAGYVAPPAGHSWYKGPDKKVIIGQDGQPIPRKRKASKGRNKPSKPVYAVPVGKLATSSTPGFNVDQHAKLKVTDFADPLHHAEWEVWFYEQRLASAKKDVERMRSLGGTVEERKEAAEAIRGMKAFENLLARSTGTAKSKIMERFAEVFAKESTGT